jgi:hypothetical protein
VRNWATEVPYRAPVSAGHFCVSFSFFTEPYSAARRRNTRAASARATPRTDFTPLAWISLPSARSRDGAAQVAPAIVRERAPSWSFRIDEFQRAALIFEQLIQLTALPRSELWSPLRAWD